MKILILNAFMFTPEKGKLPKVKTIKDTMMYNMCLGFSELGHFVTLAIGEEFRPLEDEDYDFDVRFFKSSYTKFCPPTLLPYSVELKFFLKEHHEDFDLVISSEVFMFQSFFAARICPNKTVIWHELALHQKKFCGIPSCLWYNVIARFFMNKVRCVIPRSIDSYNFIRRYMPHVAREYVEHGINIDKFMPCREKDNYVVYIGQLIERKNIPSLLRKFALYKKTDTSGLQLFLIGRGLLEMELKTIVQELDIDSYVKFVGFLNHDQLSNVLGKAKGMLIDTKQDNNMVSIPESIVSGTPVLTNKIPTNACTIEKYKLGIAKKEWGVDDIRELIDKNLYYIENCITFREKLSNKHQASLLIDLALRSFV